MASNAADFFQDLANDMGEDGFKSLGDGQNRDGDWPLPGRYIARIDRLEMAKIDDATKLFTHMTVIDVLSEQVREGFETQYPHSNRTGDQIKELFGSRPNDKYGTSAKDFFKCLSVIMGISPQVIKPDHFEVLTSDSQPAAGVFVEVAYRPYVKADTRKLIEKGTLRTEDLDKSQCKTLGGHQGWIRRLTPAEVRAKTGDSELCDTMGVGHETDYEFMGFEFGDAVEEMAEA